MFGRIKNPVRGTARLVSYEETNARNEFDTTILAQVVIEGDGVPATAVESHIGVPNSQLPLDAGTTWEIEFDRDNPKHFKTIEPDKQTAETQHAAAQQQAEQVAEQLRAGGTPAAFAGVTPQIIDLSGGAADPQRVAEAMAKVQQMFGIDLSGVTFPTPPADLPASESVPHPLSAQGETDTIGQLEKLGELHKNGVLTDEEFAAQKQKILGS